MTASCWKQPNPSHSQSIPVNPSQSQRAPVKAQSSAHGISAGRGWKRQGRLLLQIPNIPSNTEQDSAPTRSYLLRTRDTNLLTYKFSALSRHLFLFFLKYRKCVRELCGKHWGGLFHAQQRGFGKLGYQIQQQQKICLISECPAGSIIGKSN